MKSEFPKTETQTNNGPRSSDARVAVRAWAHKLDAAGEDADWRMVDDVRHDMRDWLAGDGRVDIVESYRINAGGAKVDEAIEVQRTADAQCTGCALAREEPLDEYECMKCGAKWGPRTGDARPCGECGHAYIGHLPTCSRYERCDIVESYRINESGAKVDEAIEVQRTETARDPVPTEVHERGWQWRPVGDDGAFAPPFGTVRVCIGCGCLVAGGPTRCTRCAEQPTTNRVKSSDIPLVQARPVTFDEEEPVRPTAWGPEDKMLAEDDEIEAAHPIRTKRHDIYAEAMRMVGARHSKAGLVTLVNWLLFRIDLLQRRERAPAKGPHVQVHKALWDQLREEHGNLNVACVRYERALDEIIALDARIPKNEMDTRDALRDAAALAKAARETSDCASPASTDLRPVAGEDSAGLLEGATPSGPTTPSSSKSPSRSAQPGGRDGEDGR